MPTKEKEQKIAESELKLKEREQAASSWRNPLVVAILAAAIAAAGNAGISVYNGRSQRQLESQKADQARVQKCSEPMVTRNSQRAIYNSC